MKKIIYFIIIFVSIFVLSNRINAWSKYEIGKKVEYNGNDYYVIEDSEEKNNTVKLLKAEPLSVEEVNKYGGVGTANNHVNMYNASSSDSYYQKAYNIDNNGEDTGIGGMAYYSSPTCGYNGNNMIYDGCTTDYKVSEVKYVVDAWASAQAPEANETGLITLDDLIDNLGIELNKTTPTSYQIVATEDTPTWLLGENYSYWTMTPNKDVSTDIWYVSYNSYKYVCSIRMQVQSHAVRPVIVLKKSVLGDIDDTKDESNDETNTINNKNETRSVVRVPNTLEKISIIFIMVGIVIISIGIIIVVKNKDIIRKK